MLALLLRQGVQAVAATQAKDQYEQAISRVRSRLAAVTDRDLVPGERSGDDGGGPYRWRTRIAMVAAQAPARGTTGTGPYAGGVGLYDVRVELSWPGTGGLRSVVLTTRRIGPAAMDGP